MFSKLEILTLKCSIHWEYSLVDRVLVWEALCSIAGAL